MGITIACCCASGKTLSNHIILYILNSVSCVVYGSFFKRIFQILSGPGLELLLLSNVVCSSIYRRLKRRKTSRKNAPNSGKSTKKAFDKY